ncbi:MAG TPA: aldehyde dehydrogenase family protein [Vicinamibacterales bacterium]|nr:aldehyde dehydrogenase family protein [Vicinamibacterales bacterium]
MAVQEPPRQTDKDLASIAEARALGRAARQAQPLLAELSQDQIDAIVTAMADAVTPHAEALARLAVEETGYGVVADKVQKNLFSSQRVYAFIRPMKTVGVVNRIEDKKIIEIAEPFGVVAAVVPSTNPTSTAIYKVLIALKARCPIVISPHPSAARCITRTVEIMAEAASRAGAPAGSIGWMNTVTLEGTQELMKQRETAVILATGGMGLVRAAYSAGKPAYGVGPGNAPCYIEQSADLRKAASDIITGKTFDNGVLCSSPNSVVVDESVAEETRRQFQAHGAYFMNAAEMDALAKVLVTSQRLPNPALVGKSAALIAEKVGLNVPEGTRALIAPLTGVGRDFPLSIEKLCPVLSWYVVRDWREGCERCIQILRYGGMGHTMSIHSQNDQVILEFGLKKPAFRICVNTPTTHGSIGLTTGLDPAMTLGCGGWGGNITSDNISPKHLLNIKRLAYEVRPAVNAVSAVRDADLVRSAHASLTRLAPPADLPRAPAPAPVSGGISAQALASRIDQFLASRGYKPAPDDDRSSLPAPGGSSASVPPGPVAASPAGSEAAAFVCEEDVRLAIRSGSKITLGDRTIVTPAARDLGEAHKVFVQAGWPH